MIIPVSSLKRQFLLLTTGAMLLLLAGLWLAGSHTVRVLTEDYIIERIEHEIDSLLTELNLDSHDLALLDEGRTDVVFHHAFSGHYFQIRLVGADGRVVQSLRSRSLEEDQLVDPLHGLERHSRFRTLGPQGTHLLGVTRSLSIREHRLLVSVAEEVDLYEAHFERFQRLFAGMCLGVAAAMAVALVFLLQRGFRPFRRLENQLEALAGGEVRRLDDAGVPSEVAPLVAHINWMLETTEQRVKRTRTALDNLAHTLKRPLTLLTQVADDGAMANLPEQQQLIQNNTRLMQEVIERILRRARLADPSLPGQKFTVEQEIPALVHTLKSLYYQKQLEIELELKVDTICLCDREEMFELLGNLLDNACKWARLQIRLTVEENEAGVVCTVEDDGPGCSETVLSHLTQRGRRVDESVEGHGLGLAIAQEIVMQLDGRLELGRSERLGGFLARCILPKTGRRPVEST